MNIDQCNVTACNIFMKCMNREALYHTTSHLIVSCCIVS